MDNSKQRHKELGDFLKTRRAKILPSQVGLPEGIRRRTPGLRREEVSYLSGVGLTWYTWIEQGRQIQISSQVLESLAKTLMLDKQETIHLYALAQQSPPESIPACIRNVNPNLQHVIDNFEFSPATILDSKWNILAWNRAAEKLVFDYGSISTSKRNLMRIMFTNEDFKKTIIDWESNAKGTLQRFRAVYAKFIGDTWTENLIDELKSESEEFNKWWSMHDVKTEEGLCQNVNHAVLGEIKFEYTSFAVLMDNDLRMTVLTPMPGSEAEKKVKQFLFK